MYPINDVFADYLKKRGRTWEVFIDINGTIYGKDKIIEFSIENSLTPGSDFTIGAAVASSMSMTLRLLEDLPIGAKVIPYVTMNTDDMTWLQATYAWDQASFTWLGNNLEGMPLGEFYIDSRSKINDNYSFTCLDKLVLGNSAYISQLSYPTTMQAVWNEICNEIEVENAGSVQLKLYTLNAAPTGYTMREVLGFIAAVNCGSVFIGKDGKINLRKFSADDNPCFAIDTDDYFRLKQTNPVRTFTRIEVTYDVEDKLRYEAGEGDENATIAIVNPLATQAIVNDMLSELNGFSFMPVEVDARGYPQLELGDRLTVAKQESRTWLESITAWQDTNVSWQGKTYHQTIITLLKYSFTGGLGMSFKSASKSTQQSEFNNPKILDQQINRQTQNSLKYNKTYYGVTHSRAEGIVVQREDGSAKAVFNADELSFWANGARSLWFDVPNEEWRFKGTIIASNIVSANVTGGTITGSEIWGNVLRGNNVYGGTISTRETGYPRIIMSDTANLMSAEYSATQRISIDPNGYLGNPYPFLRFVNGAFQGTIHHAGSSGWIFNSDRIVMQADLDVGSGGKIWTPNLSDYTFSTNGSLQDEIEDRVPYWEYEPKIASLEARIKALEDA